MAEHPRMHIVKGDIMDHLEQVMEGKSGIIHFAAIVGYPACDKDKAQMVGRHFCLPLLPTFSACLPMPASLPNIVCPTLTNCQLVCQLDICVIV